MYFDKDTWLVRSHYLGTCTVVLTVHINWYSSYCFHQLVWFLWVHLHVYIGTVHCQLARFLWFTTICTVPFLRLLFTL